MNQSLIIAISNRLAEPARRIFRWLGFGVSGLWITGLVVVLVGGRMLWLRWEHFQRQEIAEAFGSVGYLYGTPQPTRSGDRITFVQTIADGVGLFLCDTVTGQRQLVFEEKGGEKIGGQDFAAQPWSPDDEYFLYTKGKQPKRSIIVCQGETGAELAKIAVGKLPVSNPVWLTPNKFAFASKDGGLHLVNRQNDGKWQPTEMEGVKVGLSSFTALSSNTIAWNRADCIWAINLDTKSVTMLYRAPSDQALDTFAYSGVSGKFLLKLTQAKGAYTSLWQLLPGNARVKVAACPPTADNLTWLNVTNGSCAYLSPKTIKAVDRVLTLQSSAQAKPRRLFTHGIAESLTPSPDGRRLFIVGVVSNEPAEGIWEYDTAGETLRCVVSCSAHTSPHARHVEAVHNTLKLASGRKVNYYLYAPVNFNRHQHKYPLVIGDTMALNPENQNRASGPLWAEALACCDAYVVIVDRASWFAGLDLWEENVMEVYKHLAQNPSIDQDRVYLFGASAETRPLSELAQKRPELWKGLLLLNPSALPQITSMVPGKTAPKILISAGQAEHGEQRFNRFQTEAGQNGVPVEVVIHPNSTHWLVSIDAMQERTKAMVDFIFNN
ncbi:MAG: hypothetical protein WCH99_03630 [Verrucomicrobiota bacterium]